MAADQAQMMPAHIAALHGHEATVLPALGAADAKDLLLRHPSGYVPA